MTDRFYSRRTRILGYIFWFDLVPLSIAWFLCGTDIGFKTATVICLPGTVLLAGFIVALVEYPGD